MKSFKEFISETKASFSNPTVEKEYQMLKKMSKADLKKHWASKQKLDTSGSDIDKEGMISDLLRNKFGSKKVRDSMI